MSIIGQVPRMMHFLLIRRECDLNQEGAMVQWVVASALPTGHVASNITGIWLYALPNTPSAKSHLIENLGIQSLYNYQREHTYTQR